MQVQGDVLEEFLEYDKLLPAEIDCDIKEWWCVRVRRSSSSFPLSFPRSLPSLPPLLVHGPSFPYATPARPPGAARPPRSLLPSSSPPSLPSCMRALKFSFSMHSDARLAHMHAGGSASPFSCSARTGVSDSNPSGCTRFLKHRVLFHWLARGRRWEARQHLNPRPADAVGACAR